MYVLWKRSNMRRRSGCPTPPLSRDPFSPLPPKISVLPPTPDLCSRHRLRNGLYDSPGRNSPSRAFSADTTEDGSEDDLDCDGEPPYRFFSSPITLLCLYRFRCCRSFPSSFLYWFMVFFFEKEYYGSFLVAMIVAYYIISFCCDSGTR